jgi:hypothetical protein
MTSIAELGGDEVEKMSKRSEPRVNWNDSVEYRMEHTNVYKTGILANISNHGALLWLTEDFSVGSNLEILMRSHDKPEHVHVRVVRTEEISGKGHTGYGCRIEMTLSETTSESLPREKFWDTQVPIYSPLPFCQTPLC